MSTRADKTITYCIGIAREFQSRLSRMQVFVKHNLSTGTANEIILREFLSSHASGDFHVGQGFMCDPFEDDKVSKQCDILIYNQNAYPVVYADGPVKIVCPESTGMVIEVKTNFSKGDLNSAIDNIASAMSLNQRILGVIFAFRSPRLQTVLKNLAEYPNTIGNTHKPTAILLLDKGVIIHQWGWSRRLDIESTTNPDISAYSVRVGKSDKSAIVVAFLLLLFFEIVDQSHGLFSTNAINTAMEMLDIHTERLADAHLGVNL